MKPNGFRPLIPGALLLAAWPLGELGGAAVGLCGLHPLAFLAALAGLAAAVGAANGWGLKQLAAVAAVGELPLPITTNWIRGVAAVTACGTAAFATMIYTAEVRARWNTARWQELRQEVLSRPRGSEFWRMTGADGPAPSLSGTLVNGDSAWKSVWAARNALNGESNRPDSYIRGLAAEARFSPPEWLTLAVHRAFPLSAGLLAGAVAWRLSRGRNEPGAHAPGAGPDEGQTPPRSVRSGLNPGDHP